MTLQNETAEALEESLQALLKHHRDYETRTIDCMETISAQITDMMAETIEGAAAFRDEVEMKYRLAMSLARQSGVNAGMDLGKQAILSMPVHEIIKLKESEGYDKRVTSGELVKHIAKQAHLTVVGNNDD